MAPASGPGRSSNRERFAAAAGLLHVRVLQLQTRLQQALVVAQDGADEKDVALRIHVDPTAVLLEDAVPLGRSVGELHVVLQPRAAASPHADAQPRLRRAAILKELTDALGRRDVDPDPGLARRGRRRLGGLRLGQTEAEGSLGLLRRLRRLRRSQSDEDAVRHARLLYSRPFFFR